MEFSPAEIQAHLAAIVTSSDDGIISKDLKGNITSWNPAAERIFGYTAEEIIGRHITTIIPLDRLEEEETILTTLKTGRRVDHYETIRRHKDGHLVPVSITVSPICDASGKIIGASKVSRDISERIKAEEALKDISRKKDEFMANISHELRTPMNAVIGLAGLLKTMDSLPDKAKMFVDTLKISADNLMELINDLLDFAKIESDLMEFESVEFNLAEQVEKAVKVASVKAREKNLDVHVNYASNLSRYFRGDPLRIHQVLMNLLTNAVKFTDKGSIVVDMTATSNLTDTTLVTIRVSDTGIGIPQEKQEMIFEKFTQADSSITRRFGGSGLGLAIAKAFVEKMGGDIALTSEPGVGTTFIVHLPLKNSLQLAPMEHSPVHITPIAQAHNKNILLVEDYAPNILVASVMLEQLGYDFDVAHNGFDALKKFMHGNYDVILMDVQMPELDGLEATRRIRKMEAEKGLSRTPIVAMTAHVREQDKDKCIESGMDDFIPKPFEPLELSQKMTRYIHANVPVRLSS